MKIDPVDIESKTNARPVVNRLKQSTAEDWNEVKRITDDIVSFLHIEADDVALDDGNTFHTITFDDAFDDTNYRILGNAIVVYEDGGDGTITEKPIKNITRYTDKVTFETYKESSNYKVDYYIQKRA